MGRQRLVGGGFNTPHAQAHAHHVRQCKGAFAPRIALRQGKNARKRERKKVKEGEEKEKSQDGFQGVTETRR